MNNPEYIVAHNSASFFGTFEEVKRWHTLPVMPNYIKKAIIEGRLSKSEYFKYGNGWSDIGYQYLITNGFGTENGEYNSFEDGRVYTGRAENENGAHTLGYNNRSIGICLIGQKKKGDKYFKPTKKQKNAFITLALTLANKYGIPIKNIIGHYEVAEYKTCPEINMDYLRQELEMINLNI